MNTETEHHIIAEYKEYLSNKDFPCIAAKAAAAKHQIKCFVASNMECGRHDNNILSFLYEFIDNYRKADTRFHSAAIIFETPGSISEEHYEVLLWQRLQSLSDLDSKNYPYDPRVHADPESAKFSFSIKSEAFFIIGLHPQNSRETRRFKYPAIVFNPHAEFENMRMNGRYEKVKQIVRKKEMAHSGSLNPMLDDFGTVSEVFQYSGKAYDQSWKCPLNINHQK